MATQHMNTRTNNTIQEVKRMLNDKRLTMSQKIVMFMAYMPNVPENNSNEYLELGKQIKGLIDDQKITFGKFDKDFKLHVKHTNVLV